MYIILLYTNGGGRKLRIIEHSIRSDSHALRQLYIVISFFFEKINRILFFSLIRIVQSRPDYEFLTNLMGGATMNILKCI